MVIRRQLKQRYVLTFFEKLTRAMTSSRQRFLKRVGDSSV